MISILELMPQVPVNRGVQKPPYQPQRGVNSRPINPNNLTRGNMPVRRASLSQAIPSTPNLNNAMGMNINQMRKNQNVSPAFGTRMPATAYKMMGRKAPPGTALANVPLRR